MRGRAEKELRQQRQQVGAMIEEIFVPGQVTVTIPDPVVGESPVVLLQMFVAPIGANVYLVSKTGRLDADMAIALGEHLASEGRKAKLAVAAPGLALPDGIAA